MQAMTTNTAETTPKSGGRPYRSHKVPACDRCRKRKIRCSIDLLGQACVFFRARKLSCKYEGSNNAGASDGNNNGSEEPPAKRLRRSDAESPSHARSFHR